MVSMMMLMMMMMMICRSGGDGGGSDVAGHDLMGGANSDSCGAMTCYGSVVMMYMMSSLASQEFVILLLEFPQQLQS